MNYLGIDYGQKKIGLAISEGQLSTPLTVLTVTSLKDALNQINQVINKYQINTVVIGVPDSGQSLKMVKNFINQFNQTGIKIIEIDETLSTQNAQAMIRDMNVKKDKEDALSATLILQNYLDLNETQK